MILSLTCFCCPDLEWKLIYVGSAESTEHDQVLDCINVGPVPVGVNKFVFQVKHCLTECLRSFAQQVRPMDQERNYCLRVRIRSR